MRFAPIRATPVVVLLLGLALPSAAASQTPPPSGRPATFTVRLSGGFVTGDRILNLSSQTVTGFIVVAGIAFPIAHREDMEIQVDVSYLDYSGASYHPGGSQTLAGRAIGPNALYFYNFVRKGWAVMPFVGGGVNLAYTDETWIRQVSNPFFGPGTFESRPTGWVVTLQGAGGVQFASQSRVAFRMEGRLLLDQRGPLFLVMGGISF